MPTLIQHMGAITAFDEAPPAHGLSHLCCSAAIRQDRIYILVVTEAGHLLEYTLPQSEIVAKVSLWQSIIIAAVERLELCMIAGLTSSCLMLSAEFSGSANGRFGGLLSQRYSHRLALPVGQFWSAKYAFPNLIELLFCLWS
jgi:hypothetical protein